MPVLSKLFEVDLWDEIELGAASLDVLSNDRKLLSVVLVVNHVNVEVDVAKLRGLGQLKDGIGVV